MLCSWYVWQTTTMVGLLPVPHPILIRKYQPNEYTNLWFTTYIWGVIYLRNTNPPVFDAANIKCVPSLAQHLEYGSFGSCLSSARSACVCLDSGACCLARGRGRFA